MKSCHPRHWQGASAGGNIEPGGRAADHRQAKCERLRDDPSKLLEPALSWDTGDDENVSSCVGEMAVLDVADDADCGVRAIVADDSL